jgi:BioD-like phosphotransacetylase family protein
MPTLLITSPAPLSGKTALAVALARNLRKSEGSPTLARSGDDDHAEADRKLLTTLSGTGDTTIVELAAGTTSDPSYPGAKVLVVATPGTAADSGAMAKTAGESLAGVVLNRAPAKGEKASYEGIAPIAVIPEDRVLAAPDLASVARALEAETVNLEGNEGMTLDAPVIASIAADPGQAYFDRTRASSVIVRSDKPDLQLAALNAGPTCLIVTGGLPVLSYVRERVADEEIPLLRTKLDTKETVAAIEELFGAKPFSGGAEKLRRIGELLADVNVDALVERLGSKA